VPFAALELFADVQLFLRPEQNLPVVGAVAGGRVVFDFEEKRPVLGIQMIVVSLPDVKLIFVLAQKTRRPPGHQAGEHPCGAG